MFCFILKSGVSNVGYDFRLTLLWLSIIYKNHQHDVDMVTLWICLTQSWNTNGENHLQHHHFKYSWTPVRTSVWSERATHWECSFGSPFSQRDCNYTATKKWVNLISRSPSIKTHYCREEIQSILDSEFRRYLWLTDARSGYVIFAMEFNQ